MQYSQNESYWTALCAMIIYVLAKAILKSPSLNIQQFVFWQHFINTNKLSWSKHFFNINLSWADLQRHIKGNERHIAVQAHKNPSLPLQSLRGEWKMHLPSASVPLAKYHKWLLCVLSFGRYINAEKEKGQDENTAQKDLAKLNEFGLGVIKEENYTPS